MNIWKHLELRSIPKVQRFGGGAEQGAARVVIGKLVAMLREQLDGLPQDADHGVVIEQETTHNMPAVVVGQGFSLFCTGSADGNGDFQPGVAVCRERATEPYSDELPPLKIDADGEPVLNSKGIQIQPSTPRAIVTGTFRNELHKDGDFSIMVKSRPDGSYLYRVPEKDRAKARAKFERREVDRAAADELGLTVTEYRKLDKATAIQAAA